MLTAKPSNRQVLIVRHLPTELSDAEKEDLLRHFGAVSVRILPSKRKPIVIATFETEAQARGTLFRLHQLDVLGSKLVVEYAKDAPLTSDPRMDKVDNNEQGKEYFKEFKRKLNSWNRSVDFHQPPPPHLKYAYPRANVATINNIAHALASVPKFYTQVLHLMNKMNLPPPFSNQPDPPQQIPQPIVKSDSESEMESDPEDTKIDENTPTLKRKAPKRIKFTKPGQFVVRDPVDPSEVFDRPGVSQPRIELRVTSDSIESIKSKAESIFESGDSFSRLRRCETPLMDEERDPIDDPPKPSSSFEKSGVVTIKELIANRISENEFVHVPAFKNYHPGVPSSRVYLKNLGKTVTKEDLEYVYQRYGEVEIRLMQEGRMKGQAFITMESMELAQRAVKETNGFVLKGKPIVAVFGKNVTAKPDPVPEKED